jgi:Tol biopolymer transport system component
VPPDEEPARTIQMTALSPDGRTLVYPRDRRRGRRRRVAQRTLRRLRARRPPQNDVIYAVSTQADDPARIQLAAPGREPRWSRDGRELFFRSQDAMFSLPIQEMRGTLAIGHPVLLFRGDYDERPLSRANYDVMPDGTS